MKELRFWYAAVVCSFIQFACVICKHIYLGNYGFATLFALTAVIAALIITYIIHTIRKATNA